MAKYRFLYCFWHTAKLKVYYKILRFDRITAGYKRHSLRLELADTRHKRQLGLSFRDGIGNNEGMILAYPKIRRHIIWMMNMRFGIDILWLDKNKRIISIVENAPSSDSWCDFAIYNPNRKSQYVVELAEGTVKRLKIRPGDTIRFSLTQSITQ